MVVFLFRCSKAACSTTQLDILYCAAHCWTIERGGQEGFRAVKRRSGLETEMIILVFFKNCPATSFSCDLPLSGWWHAFKSRVLQFLLTAHMHTLSPVLPSEKEVLSHCPFYNRKCWSQDAQWTRVTFMGQDAHSNASWFSQQGCETQWHL